MLLRNTIKYSLFVCSLAVAGACDVSSGQRHEHGCPEDEICSDQTPGGLLFAGPLLGDKLFDSEVYPVAVGGTSHIRVLADDGAAFALPYQALTSGPALSIAGQDGNEVLVGADQAGSALLRIVDAEDLLFDRIELNAAPISDVGIAAYAFDTFPDATSFALARNTTSTVVIALLDEAGNRLVDDSLTITPNTPATQITHSSQSWSWSIVDVTPSEESASFTVLAGGNDYSIDLPTTTTLDEIALAFEPVVVRNESSQVCFAGLFNGDTVLGVSWQISIDGAAPIAPLYNCVDVTTDDTSVVLDVTGLGGAQTFVLQTVGASARKAKPSKAGTAVPAALGQRAVAAKLAR